MVQAKFLCILKNLLYGLIQKCNCFLGTFAVALPTEGVDRNNTMLDPSIAVSVALPTEGVDRNCTALPGGYCPDVALPTEGVDRNRSLKSVSAGLETSPSPRRAWIEIVRNFVLLRPAPVALPTEGVDRNTTAAPYWQH